MNWKLVFLLSLSGILIGTILLFGLSVYLELLLWIIVIIIDAYQIAKSGFKRFFLQGFAVGIFSFIWITGVLILFAETYFNNHPWWKMMFLSGMPNIVWVVIALIFCTVTSLFTGYNTYLIGKWLKKTSGPRLKQIYYHNPKDNQ